MNDDTDEYQIQDAPEAGFCPSCGGRLVRGKCGQCTNLLEQLDAKFGDEVRESREASSSYDGAEMDEYGMPVEQEEDRSDWQLEKPRDGELPITFYIVSISVVVVLALLSMATNRPSAVAWWGGIVGLIAGVAGHVIAYRKLQDVGSIGETKFMPLKALVEMLSPGATQGLPDHPGVEWGKWSLVGILASSVLMLIGWAIGQFTG